MSRTLANQVNTILEPFLFQVVGSTPESLRDIIKKTSLRNNPSAAAKVAALCIFASAVNKATMEGLLARPEMVDVRSIVASGISINNRPNMTSMTLLGHCLLTTDWATEIVFAKKFRDKLGQDHIWAGGLENGSLSEKQKRILKEKAGNTSVSSAKLLGSGFLKFTGIARDAYTVAEAEFWGEQVASKSQAEHQETSPPARSTRHQAVASTSSRAPAQAVSETSPPRARTTSVTLPDGSTVLVSERAYNYYMGANRGNFDALVESVARQGVESFNYKYELLDEKDPERRGVGVHSVVG